MTNRSPRTRSESIVRGGVERRRPGNGIRSAILLSGLTTMLRVVTASRRVSIVGASALLGQCADLAPGVHESNGVTITCGE